MRAVRRKPIRRLPGIVGLPPSDCLFGSTPQMAHARERTEKSQIRLRKRSPARFANAGDAPSRSESPERLRGQRPTLLRRTMRMSQGDCSYVSSSPLGLPIGNARSVRAEQRWVGRRKRSSALESCSESCASVMECISSARRVIYFPSRGQVFPTRGASGLHDARRRHNAASIHPARGRTGARYTNRRSPSSIGAAPSPNWYCGSTSSLMRSITTSM